MEMKTYIRCSVLLKIAEEEGCEATSKSTCIKLKKKGAKTNNRLYICAPGDKPEAQVHRINVNGFKVPDPEIARTPRNGPVGTFLQEMRFDQPEPKVLANFREVCRNLDTYPPEGKKERQRPAAFKGNKRTDPPKGPDLEVKMEETVEQHAERLIAEFKKKREIAAKMGFPLSKKLVSDYEQKVQKLGYRLEG